MNNKTEYTEENINEYASHLVEAIQSYAENDGRYFPAKKFNSLMSFKQNIKNSLLITPYEIEELSDLVGERIALKIMNMAKNRAAITRSFRKNYLRGLR